MDPKRTKRLLSPPHSAFARSGRRLARPLTMIAVLLLLAVGVLAPAGQASEAAPESISAATHQAVRAAERASRAALRAAQKAAEKQRRAAERLARREANRLAHYQSREAQRLALKEKDHNVVTIDCKKVTAAYSEFPAVEGSPNIVTEWITIKNPPASLGPGPIEITPKEGRVFSFEGSSGTDVVPIAFPIGHYLIDVHAKWNTNGHKGDFDIHGNVTCGPAPEFAISKLQTIVGSGKPLTPETLTGKVGETVEYQIAVKNTGNTPLTFGKLEDPICDPGTIVGGSLSPIEPTESLVFTCTHTLTAADETAGSVRNIAKIRAEAEEFEGPPVTHESNPVVVTPIAPKEKAKEEPKEEPKEENEQPKKEEPKKEEPQPKGETKGSTETGPVNSGNNPGSTEVLGFKATVPSLKGPQGCVRGSFTVSIRATGVSSVIFYLDGHRIGRLTYKNAHKGLLSIRINPSKLKIGAHRLIAAITMKQTAPTAKAAKGSRRLTVIRCKSSAVTPHFTG